jgi:hypothetical protein
MLDWEKMLKHDVSCFLKLFINFLVMLFASYNGMLFDLIKGHARTTHEITIYAVYIDVV